jgi:hypothetical protein
MHQSDLEPHQPLAYDNNVIGVDHTQGAYALRLSFNGPPFTAAHNFDKELPQHSKSRKTT